MEKEKKKEIREEMRLIDRHVFKALTNQISESEFEAYLYQDHVIDTIDSDKLIFDLVNINYRKESWKKDLRNVINKNFKDEDILAYHFYFYCFRLLQVKNESEIYDIVDQLAANYIKFDYNHKSFLEFYRFNSRWNMVLDEVSHENLNEIIIDVKEFSRKIIDIYGKTKEIKRLLNISSDIPLETWQEPDKEEIIDFLSNKKFKLESVDEYDTVLEGYYSENQIQEIKLDTIRSIRSKIINRLPIFLIIGLSLFAGSYNGVLDGKVGFIYVIFLIGIGLLLSAITDIIQLIWYSRYK
ncbi:hypothetical protein [Aquimarina sp. 433]